MAKKKKKEDSGKAARIAKGICIGLLVVAIIAVLVIAGISSYKYFLGDGRVDTFSVVHNGKMYNQDAQGIELLSGDEINVYYLTGDGGYEVEVTANTQHDFEFQVGAESWKWSDTADRTFTGGFKITQTKYGFKLEYESLADIISTAFSGREITVDEPAVRGDVFKLTVKYGDESITLTFAVGKEIEDIEINPGEIVIAAEEDS